jgi:hypothetical protein
MIGQQPIKFFDDTLDEKGLPDWFFLQKRMNRQPRPAVRVSTNRVELDNVLGGGVPLGLTTIYGDSGTGKSKLANSIAYGILQRPGRLLYFYGEDSKDAPVPDGKTVINVDMMSWKPAPEKACKILLKYCEMLQPTIVIIDSMTSIFGATNLAVQEAEVRTWVQVFAEHISGKLAAVGISETRGTGYNIKTAGGTGVLFPSITNIYLEKIKLDNKWTAYRYRGKEGDRVHTFYVAKDRDGKASQLKEYILTYMGEEPFFNELQQWVDKREESNYAGNKGYGSSY